MIPAVYHDLMRHMEWADAMVWGSVLALPQAEADKRIRDRLSHLHVVQWAYLEIWRDESPGVPDPSSFENLAAIHAWARDYYDKVAVELARLDATALERQIQFPWAEQLVERFGTPMPATFAETILQITSHTTYHRGQINMRLRELGAEPPLTDFIAWIWMGKPDAEWESNAGA